MGGFRLNDNTCTGIIIQARMCSKRLPGKIFRKIGNKTLLEYIIFRLSFLKHSVKIVLATTDNPDDNIVEEFCRLNNIKCFRGSENNVLERYYLCAKKEKFDHVIRLTGDNPFIDIEELDCLIDLHIKTNSDFTHSFESLPVGIGAEIFTFTALEKSYLGGKEPHHLEHVNEYMLENPQIFKTTKLKVAENKNRPDLTLTVDTEKDHKKTCYIVQNAKNEFITTEEAIDLCLQYV